VAHLKYSAYRANFIGFSMFVKLLIILYCCEHI
jgi:hypothetical protein